MDNRFSEDNQVNARKVFYDTMQEHLKKGLDYHQFWETKKQGLLKIKTYLQNIADNRYENNVNVLNPTIEYENCVSEQFEKIKFTLNEINLKIDDIDKVGVFENLKIRFFINEYIKYEEDPQNYSFYTLQPLKTDRVELIMQIKEEIIENYDKGKGDEYERSRERDRKYEIESSVNTFIGLLDMSKSQNIINKIIEKYLETEFRAVLNNSRLNSYDDFFKQSTLKSYDSKRYRWEDLRHFIRERINILGFYSAIKEIREDVMILERLGYFENATPSVSKKITIKQRLLILNYENKIPNREFNKAQTAKDINKDYGYSEQRIRTILSCWGRDSENNPITKDNLEYVKTYFEENNKSDLAEKVKKDLEQLINNQLNKSSRGK